MPTTTFFTPSRTLFLTCFLLVLVVFSTTMRFVGLDIISIDIKEIKNELVENNLSNLITSKITTKSNTKSNSKVINIPSTTHKTTEGTATEDKTTKDKKTEKEPTTLQTSHSSDALLQGIIHTELFQNIILIPLVEFVFPSFSLELINSVAYHFTSSTFFKTLFNCFISPNAP